MKTTTILDMLSDFVTDALNDEKHSPEEVVDAIRGTISEWAEYHSVQGKKAERVLELLDGRDTITGQGINIESPRTDTVSFGTYEPVDYPYNPINNSLFV